MTVTVLHADQYESGLDRIPPQNIEAEMALLGSVLVDASMFELVAEIVQPADFYASLHESVYLALHALATRNAPLDKVALAEELRTRGMLDKIGGLAYLNSLMDTVPTAASAEYYARIVHEKATARGLIHAGTEIARLGYDGEDDVNEAVNRAEQKLAEVAARGNVAVRAIQPGAVLDKLVREMLSPDPVRVILSPWSKQNDVIGGFSEAELVGIVAPAKHGKTGYAVTNAEYIAEMHGPSPFFATEMGAAAIERRRIALRSGVSARKQRMKTFSSYELDRAVMAGRELQSQRLFVFDKEHRSLRAIWRGCRDVRKRFGPLACITIDHVGFIDEARLFGKNTTETQALDLVYRELLTIASHFACPLFVVLHPNRTGSTSAVSQSTLHTLRGGGALENHAHAVLAPWRSDPIGKPHEGELVVLAARDGAQASIPMFYDGARAAWSEMDGENVVPLWFERRGFVNAPQLAMALPTRNDAEEDVASDVPLDEIGDAFDAYTPEPIY